MKLALESRLNPKHSYSHWIGTIKSKFNFLYMWLYYRTFYIFCATKLLYDDAMGRFQDVITSDILSWYSKLFKAQAVYYEDDVREELFGLKDDNDVTDRYPFHSKEGLWYHKSILSSYPNLWKHFKLILLAFPMSHLVEYGFSHKCYFNF